MRLTHHLDLICGSSRSSLLSRLTSHGSIIQDKLLLHVNLDFFYGVRRGCHAGLLFLDVHVRLRRRANSRLIVDLACICWVNSEPRRDLSGRHSSAHLLSLGLLLLYEGLSWR